MPAVMTDTADGLPAPFYLSDRFGYSAVEIGLLITPWPIAIAFAAPAACWARRGCWARQSARRWWRCSWRAIRREVRGSPFLSVSASRCLVPRLARYGCRQPVRVAPEAVRVREGQRATGE
jgi:hypothetical protein